MELENNPITNIMQKKIDADKLDEMRKNYYPKSEEIFNTTWDLTEDHKYLSDEDEVNDDTIVKNLYKDM